MKGRLKLFSDGLLFCYFKKGANITPLVENIISFMRQILSDGLDWLEGFFSGWSRDTAQLPFVHATTQLSGQVPFFGNGRIRQRVVVLQIGANTGSRQCCPNSILNHGICLIRPDRKVGRIRWELLLQPLTHLDLQRTKLSPRLL